MLVCHWPVDFKLTRLLVPPGEISTRTVLDREQQSNYQLAVLVQDGGSPSRSATGTAFITVLDENDNDPTFTHSLSGKSLIIQVTRHGRAPRPVLKYVQYLHFFDTCLFGFNL